MRHYLVYLITLTIINIEIKSLNAQSKNHSNLISSYINNPNYIITDDSYKHGSVLINIIQANAKNNQVNEQVLCAAWIFINSNKSVIDSIVFPDIVSMGGKAGLFVPKKQFSDSLFVIVKLGDYDGKLILITLKGHVLCFPGGSYYLSKNKKFLFSISQLDCSGISVIDLRTLKSIYSVTCLPKNPDYWYLKGHNYYFISIDFPDSAFFYKGPDRGFVLKSINNKFRESSDRLKLDFNP